MKALWAIAALAALAVTGCSSSSSSTNAASQSAATEAPAQAESAAPASGGETGPAPVYPGSTKLTGMATVGNMSVKVCGSTVSTVTYNPHEDDMNKIEQWYEGQLHDPLKLAMNQNVHMQIEEFYSSDGDMAISLIKPNFGNDPQAKAVAEKMGMGNVLLGVANISPPLPPDVLDLMRQAHGDMQDAGVRAKLKARCPDLAHWLGRSS